VADQTPSRASHSEWHPRHPDPALLNPDAPGLRAHRHPPNRLHAWVFVQRTVWVDFWGNEHALVSMNDDYLRNVLAFVRGDASRIRDIVVLDLVIEQLLRVVAGVPFDPDAGRASSAYEIEAATWLEQTPLVRTLNELVANADAADENEGAQP
jgi:hypothetical protein